MNSALTGFVIRRFSMGMIIAAATAILAAAAVALATPQTVSADHNSLYTICPGSISEGNEGWMGIRRPGYKVVYAVIFTHHGEYSASPDDFEEYHGVKFEADSGENTVWVRIVTKEDSLPEHDETFAIGFMADSVWHECIVTIADDDAPAISGIEISTEPVDGHAYRTGESIDVTVDFEAKVEVEGAPLLALFIGDGDDTWRGAEYLRGSGTRHLVFRYRVQPGDFDDDGITVGAAAVAGDRSAAYGFSGNIYAEGTDVPIDYAHPGIQGDWRQKVDGRPYVQSARITSSPSDGWEAYRSHQTIEITLTFDMDVMVEGDVSVDLHLGLDDANWDEATRKASYIRGSGTDTLVFGYTVQPGDMDPEGVGIIMGAILDWNETGFDGSGTIRAKGTDVERNPWYLGTGHQPEHKVDTELPLISSVNVTSQPANGEAYGVGERISVEVLFSEQVIANGEPQLELEIGGAARKATLQSPADETFSDSMVFWYDVQEGDGDSDGSGAKTIILKLNCGQINDRAGNTSDLAFDVVVSEPNQRVDTSRAEQARAARST